MKLKNLLYATVGSAVLAFSTASCSDYLDISGEFNASLGVDQVWDNATYTRKLVRGHLPQSDGIFRNRIRS